MQSFWQHLPETINPIAFSIGFFSVYWYALFFLSGIFAAFLFARLFIRRGEVPYSEEVISDLLLFLFFGALIGGRLGYVLFYNPEFFLGAPFLVFSPYDFGVGMWTGLSGMSYHGGLLGVIVALYFFTRKRKIAFWKMADSVALLVPVATFFGRLGNFFNVELYGRVTTKPWGMLFPDALPRGVLRHPSTLYEAFFEGVVLFGIVLFFRKRVPFPGSLACIYLAGYACLRFGGEYFREPDAQRGLFLGGMFSLGQIFSVAMLLITTLVFLWLKDKNHDKIT